MNGPGIETRQVWTHASDGSTRAGSSGTGISASGVDDAIGGPADRTASRERGSSEGSGFPLSGGARRARQQAGQEEYRQQPSRTDASKSKSKSRVEEGMEGSEGSDVGVEGSPVREAQRRLDFASTQVGGGEGQGVRVAEREQQQRQPPAQPIHALNALANTGAGRVPSGPPIRVTTDSHSPPPSNRAGQGNPNGLQVDVVPFGGSSSSSSRPGRPSPLLDTEGDEPSAAGMVPPPRTPSPPLSSARSPENRGVQGGARQGSAWQHHQHVQQQAVQQPWQQQQQQQWQQRQRQQQQQQQQRIPWNQQKPVQQQQRQLAGKGQQQPGASAGVGAWRRDGTSAGAVNAQMAGMQQSQVSWHLAVRWSLRRRATAAKDHLSTVP